jgi:hypothetical protein
MASAAIAYVLTQSLAPTAAAEAARPRVSIAGLSAGTYRYLRYPGEHAQRRAEVLFIRTAEGRLFAWWIPISEGLHLLPDRQWWKAGPPCRDLRPDFEAQLIRCLDSELFDWAKENYRWRLDGKSLSKQVPDMEAVAGVEESDDFVFDLRPSR